MLLAVSSAGTCNLDNVELLTAKRKPSSIISASLYKPCCHTAIWQ